MSELEHIVHKGEFTLCQLEADSVTVAMFVDDADCPKCIAVEEVLTNA